MVEIQKGNATSIANIRAALTTIEHKLSIHDRAFIEMELRMIENSIKRIRDRMS